MSAATASSTDMTLVHVRLLDEGTDVWRPVEAERLGETTYGLADVPIPDEERWSFQPRDIVMVERRGGEAEDGLIAVAKVTDFGDRSWASRRKVA